MSQSTVAITRGLYLVPKSPALRVVPRKASRTLGPVLVTWTAEPKPKKGRRLVVFLGAIAAPLGWFGHTFFAAHRG
jgi:hypothetical protein